MIEARITCLTAEFIVADLGMTLNYGDEVYISEGKARKSRDLKTGRRAGAVRVDYVQRYTMSKPPKPPARPLPPHVRMTRRGFKAGPPDTTASPESAKPQPSTPPKEDPRVEALQREIAELRKVIQDLPGQMAKALAAQAGPGTVHQTSRAPVPSGDEGGHDEPVFIPSNIVRKGEKAEVKVKSGSTKADGLDDAAAALRAAKPKRSRKRRTRKKTTKTEG